LRWQQLALAAVSAGISAQAAVCAGSSDAFSASMTAMILPGGSFTMILQFSPYELADRLAKGVE
jgi:hypothetical protein